MSLTTPLSTSGSNTSCCDLLNRWISSMNRIVAVPVFSSRLAAADSTRRMSATLDSTPLKRSNLLLVWRAMICASDVLPVPGGPKKISDWMRSASMARRSNCPGARMCVWPANSSSVRGRIRAASGWLRGKFSAAVDAIFRSGFSRGLEINHRAPWGQFSNRAVNCPKQNSRVPRGLKPNSEVRTGRLVEQASSLPHSANPFGKMPQFPGGN